MMRYFKDEEQKCNINDVFYAIKKEKVTKVVITEIERMELGHYIYRTDQGERYFERSFGKTLFKSPSDCEQELWRRNTIMKKRAMLKEYEKVLNTKLNLENHFIF